MASEIREHVLDAPVHEVTLLEDRARVIRRGSITLPAGLHRVRIEGAASALSDKTLTGEIDKSGAKLVDVRVERRLMVSYDDPGRAPDADAEALQAELRDAEAELQRVEIEAALVERHAAGLDKIAQLTYAELAEDVSRGREIGDPWSVRLDDFQSSERALRQRIIELSTEVDERKRGLKRLQHRIEQLTNPPEREWAAIVADISVSQAGSFQVSCDYLVPGACWRPYHTAHLIEPEPDKERKAKDDAGDGTSLTFRTDACVWQNTGEDWDDVQLVFSTERASLGIEPPVLRSDVLRVTRKSDAVVVEAREQEIQTTGLGADEQGETRAAKDLPGIDDGGVVQSFRASQRSSVPSDGKPYRIHLQSFDSNAEVSLASMPEIAQCVITRSVQSNAGSGPILAGPVDLIRRSGFIGRTSVLYIAAGERFDLGWGPEPDLRVKRTANVTEEKSRLLSSWIERTHEVYVMLSNLGHHKHVIELTERIPVTEIDKVKIEVNAKETSNSQKPDSNGFVKWHVTLQPGGYERVQLRYLLKKHEDVVGI